MCHNGASSRFLLLYCFADTANQQLFVISLSNCDQVRRLRAIFLNLPSVFLFLLADFICRCASANNFTMQKLGKCCVEWMNRTAHTAFEIRMACRIPKQTCSDFRHAIL